MPLAIVDNNLIEKCRVFYPRTDETLSNGERIRRMTDEELAEFLSRIAYAGKEPWSEPFARLFCDQCPEPEYTLGDGRKLRLHECDFSDGKCPHGNDIIWWLNQQAAEEGDC